MGSEPNRPCPVCGGAKIRGTFFTRPAAGGRIDEMSRSWLYCPTCRERTLEAVREIFKDIERED